jgi:lysophospholipase L1-like esterase
MQTVVCFGDSITRGQVSASYVDLLSADPTLRDFRFINAGVNSDLTLNLLRRVKRVAALKPDIVTILVGTNDLIATIRPYSALYFWLAKGMYYQPDLLYSTDNLTKVIHYLKQHTHAAIALASIPPLGEALDSRPMHLVRRYNAAWQKIVVDEKIDYLPVFESMTTRLAALNGNARRMYNGSVFLTAEFVARHLLAGESFERYSERKGFNLFTDGVHMNPRGAALIAEQIAGYLTSRAV